MNFLFDYVIAKQISFFDILGLIIGIINAFLPMQEINEKFFKINENTLNPSVKIPEIKLDENLSYFDAEQFFETVKF